MRNNAYGYITEIWEPRYRDKKALIGRHHVQEGINYITFTKAEHLKGKVFSVHSDVIKSQPLQANGRGEVYCVPMSFLNLVGHLTDTVNPVSEADSRKEEAKGAIKRLGFTIIDERDKGETFLIEGKKGDEVLRIGETVGEILSWNRNTDNSITLTSVHEFVWTDENDITDALQSYQMIHTVAK